jgi:hypothetical protein
LNRGVEIRYTRYANDWIIGVKGPQKLAQQLKDEITIFLGNHLKQVKPTITNLRAGKVRFLGYDIFLPRNMKLVKYSNKTRMLRFQLPIDQVTKRLHERGYIGYFNNKIHPISKGSYTPLEDVVIVNHFRSVWLGLYNFYSGSTNRSHLQYIHYLLHISCAMTLAHRHRSSSSKIFKKHGKKLEIIETKGKDTKVIASFPYQTSWKVSDRKWQNVRTFKDPFTSQSTLLYL